MRLGTVILLASLAASCLCIAQEPPPLDENAPSLTEMQEDLEYLEMLNAMSLSSEQLVTLQRMQATYADKAVLPPEALEWVDAIYDEMLRGKSADEAIASLGEKERDFRQVQQGLQMTTQALAREFCTTLTKDQILALAIHNSPARAVKNLATQLRRARKAPDEFWKQFRRHASMTLLNVARQTGQQNIDQATVEGLLDSVRALSDADFKTKQETLAAEWLRKLTPRILEAAERGPADNPQLVWACSRLISHPRGSALVESKLKAMGEK